MQQHAADRAGAVEALLEGADGLAASVDATDDRGRTALSHAARCGSLDCIRCGQSWVL